MNLISRESPTVKSCKALRLSLTRPHVALSGQAYVDPRRPHPFTIMKLHTFETKQGGHDWHWILKDQ